MRRKTFLKLTSAIAGGSLLGFGGAWARKQDWQEIFAMMDRGSGLFHKDIQKLLSNMPSYDAVITRLSTGAELLLDDAISVDDETFVRTDGGIAKEYSPDDQSTSWSVVESTGYQTIDDLHVPNIWNRESVESRLGSTSKYKTRLDYLEDIIPVAVASYLTDESGYKIPPSVMCVQAILESNSGRSRLASGYNNHFGIKAPPNEAGQKLIDAGDIASLNTKHFIVIPPAIGVVQQRDEHSWNRFQVYKTRMDCFRAYMTLLRNPRYNWIWKKWKIGDTQCSIKDPVLKRTHSSIERNRKYDGQPIKPEHFFGKENIHNLPYYAAMFAGIKVSGYATSPPYHRKLTKLFEDLELARLDWWAHTMLTMIQNS